MPTPYAHPEVLVTADWARAHLNDPAVRFVEIDVDTTQYAAGHLPGAVAFHWQRDLQDQVTRDIPSRAEFERILSKAGIRESDTVVLYGDNHNWFAAYGFWLFKLYGHADVRLLDGGRARWLADPANPLTPTPSEHAPSTYRVAGINAVLRARLGEVLDIATSRRARLVDVRSTDEYTGRVIAPPGLDETAQRAGRIPGARNAPWSLAVNADGTFKSREALEDLYLNQLGLTPDQETITYCRIGERSSHTWFVLQYLLGFRKVKNYDGSWTEYGNLIGVPIERDATPARAAASQIPAARP
jgi:thiosulfate/3-mercaptopyruvate sulfurtransferase